MNSGMFHEHQHSPQSSVKSERREESPSQDQEAMLLENHKKFLWTHYTNLLWVSGC